MSFENHNTKQINYEYQKRDLATKYSHAVSRLGTDEPEKKQFWLNQLEKVSRRQQELEAEYRK